MTDKELREIEERNGNALYHVEMEGECPDCGSEYMNDIAALLAEVRRQPLVDVDQEKIERYEKALRAYMNRDHVTLVGSAQTPCCAYCSVILDNSEHDEECPVVLGRQAFGGE